MEGKRKRTFSAHSFIPRATFTGSWTGALLLFHSNQWAVYFRVDPAHQHLGTKCWVLGRGEDLIFPGTQIEAKTSRYIVRSCKRVGRIQCADFIIQIRGTSQTALGYSIHFFTWVLCFRSKLYHVLLLSKCKTFTKFPYCAPEQENEISNFYLSKHFSHVFHTYPRVIFTFVML